MALFDIFKKRGGKKQPEDEYEIITTPDYVRVEHPKRKPEQINWRDIDEIAIITTDEGPWQPDVWLFLSGQYSGCTVPWDAPKYNDIFDVISKYDGFNFEEYFKAASCTDNARFDVWQRKVV